MSNDRQQVSHGHSHAGVGVSGLGPPKDIYEPKKHNGATPLRPDSMDAFKKPSLDHTGKRKPYWSSME